MALVDPTQLEALRRSARMAKFGNKKTRVGDVVFDSKAEAERYQVLRTQAHVGAIRELKLQTSFPLVVNGVKICTYRADFEYVRDGQRIVEDCKGMLTPVYRLKKKLMLAIYGITILESRAWKKGSARLKAARPS